MKAPWNQRPPDGVARIALVAFLIATILPVPRTSCAFDDQRKGFIIGLGAGAGYSFGEQPDLPWRSDAEQNEFGGTFEGKIGYGWSRLGMFADYRSAAYSGFSTSITGLGVAYYLSDQAPGLYLTGTIGASRWYGFDPEGGGAGSVWRITRRRRPVSAFAPAQAGRSGGTGQSRRA